MSDDVLTPDNNLVLRNLQGMRRDMHEMIERQARAIELMNRLALRVGELSNRVGELSTRMDKGFNDVQSDMLLLENKVLSAQSDIMRVVRRLDEGSANDRLALDP
jgi:hypothetical protein